MYIMIMNNLIIQKLIYNDYEKAFLLYVITTKKYVYNKHIKLYI